MKNYSHQIAVLACAALALCGCVKEGWVTGRAIRFGAGSQAESLTKTAYGDITTDSGTGKRTHQMVDWKEGDVIRIVCEQASTAETGTSTSADYQTSAGTKSGTESRATLSLASNNDKGLRWGSTEAAHVFYAVYPSPQVKSGTSLTVEGAFTGIIPESQSVASVSGTSPSFVAAPDMTNQYMVAKRTVAAGTQEISEEEVFLNFTPVTTAIEFEIKNGMDDALGISSIELISAASYLSGTFTSSLEGLNENGLYPSGYPGFTAGSDKKKTAKVDFGTSGRTLAVGDILTLTVFLLPESDLGDLTFRINKLDGTYIQTALKSDASTWIGFERCKKHFIHGLLVQDGAKWTLCFDPDVDPWDGSTGDIGKNLNDPALAGAPSLIQWEGGDESDIDLEESAGFVFTFGDGTGEATQTFSGDLGDLASTSRIKKVEITSTQGDESQAWKIKTVDGNEVTDNSYTISNQLKVTKGTDGKLAIEDLRLKTSYGDNAHWTTSGTDWYRASLSGTIDLSKRDFRTGNTIGMRTANCYIVRNAGTYQIPLVYGNAIDFSKPGLTDGKNTQSYAPTIASGGSNGLTPFVNHSGYGISDPYIENNTGDGTEFHKNRRLKPQSAAIVWQDVEDVIGNVGLSKQTNGDNKCNENNCGYITFTISQNNICQCNAVIAVYDGANGTGNILWSWHIWVTNNPALGEQAIAVTNYAEKTSSFLAAPAIGWIDPDLYEKKDDVVIVLEQEDSGEQITVTVKQQEYVFNGQGTLYQFGRKDPMRLSASSDTDTGAGINASILNPATFYKDWTSGGYYNLWTGKESKRYSLETLTGNITDAEEGDNMVKTIYDPSPAGYKVPSVKVFTGFTKEGKKCGDKAPAVYPLSDSNVSGSYHNGWDFYTSSSKSSTIYFPKVYNRESSGSPISFALGRYFTSTPNSDSGNSAFEFQFQSTYVYPMTEKSSRANALCIRPITE